MKDIFLAIGHAIHTALPDVVLGCTLAFLSIVFYRILVRKSKDRTSRIDLEELLLNDERTGMSKPAAVLFGSWLVTSWVIVFQSFHGTLTDLSFGAYMAVWASPTLMKIYKGDPQPAPPGPTTTVTADKVEIKQ